jgi:hypothetical protein
MHRLVRKNILHNFMNIVGINTKPKETPIDIVEDSSSKLARTGEYIDNYKVCK